MENEMVRDVFRALRRTIAADLSSEVEFHSHQIACEIGKSSSPPNCLYDPDAALLLTRSLAECSSYLLAHPLL